MTKERLRVYVDGFNLYHGLHDAARCKLLWLDLVKLAESLRPLSTVDHVHYFTAPVLGDPGAASRQAEYQSALLAANEGRITIWQGRYQSKKKECRQCGAQWNEREEKETDVSIAVRLVADASLKLMESAMVISADSDLAPAIKTARELNPSLTIFAAFPPERFSAELKTAMPSSFHINRNRVKQAQLPEQVVHPRTQVVLRRPSKWKS